MHLETIFLVKDLIARMAGRLDQGLLDDARHVLEHNESVLAFETVCDHLCDFQIEISLDEYRLIEYIDSQSSSKLHELVLPYLAKHIVMPVPLSVLSVPSTVVVLSTADTPLSTSNTTVL